MALVILFFKAFHLKETVLTLIKNPDPFLKQKYTLQGKTTLYSSLLN